MARRKRVLRSTQRFFTATPVNGRGRKKHRYGQVYLERFSLLLKFIRLSVTPFSCACGAPGTHVCDDCAAWLYEPPVRVEAVCDALQIAQADSHYAEKYVPLMPVVSLGEYSGPLRELVLDFKNGGHFVLARLFAERCAHAVEDQGCMGTHPHIIVPAPSTMRSVRARGEDHMRLVAEDTAHLLGKQWTVKVAPRLRLRGKSQHSLNRRDRADVAARGISAVSRRQWNECSRMHAFIMDDVVTTGHTLRILHRFLAEHNIEVCGAVTIASARLPKTESVPAC